MKWTSTTAAAGTALLLQAGMAIAAGEPRVNIPDDVMVRGAFTPTCPPEVQELHARIWTGTA